MSGAVIARCRRSAVVEDPITHEGSTSEPGRSHARPGVLDPAGPHREGEEPEPVMNGDEKSDPAVVAGKPMNKAGQPAAESVERRAGAEGNAGRHSTLRTQIRERVTQALDRVRQAA